MTSETRVRHTPGPWAHRRWTIWHDSSRIAEVREGGPHPEGVRGDTLLAEIDANATLIAAAPELLVALEMVNDFLDGKRHDTLTVSQTVRTIVAKARGEA